MKLFGNRTNDRKKDEHRGQFFKFGWKKQLASSSEAKKGKRQILDQSAEQKKDVSSVKKTSVKEQAGAGSKKREAGKDTKNAYRILIRPHVTEKSTMSVAGGTYVFAVAPFVNKVEIKKAVYNAYGIMPKKVAIINQKGKQVRRGKITGWTKKWKKAMVVLPKGEHIDVYSGV